MRALKLRRKLMHTILNAGLYFTEPIFLSFLGAASKPTKKNPQTNLRSQCQSFPAASTVVDSVGICLPNPQHLKPHIFWIPPPPHHYQNVCCDTDPRQFLSYDFSAFSQFQIVPPDQTEVFVLWVLLQSAGRCVSCCEGICCQEGDFKSPSSALC